MRALRMQLLAPALVVAIVLGAGEVGAQGFSVSQPFHLLDPEVQEGNSEVALATDGTGLWLASWIIRQVGTTNDSVVVARSTDGGRTWGVPQLVKPVDAGEDEDPSLVYDGAGTFLLAWNSYDKLGGPIGDGGMDILVARSTTGGASWIPPVLLAPNAATDGYYNFAPQLAADGAGNWVAVWQARFPEQVVVSRSSDGGFTWTVPVAIGTYLHNGDAGFQNVRIATNGTGTWIAAWSGPIGINGSAVYVARSTDAGATWSPPAPVDAGLRRHPSIAVDGSRWLIAGSDPVAVHRSIDDGLTWTPALALDFGFFPYIASNGTGTSIVAFVAERASFTYDTDLASVRTDDGGVTWSAPALADTRALKDYPDDDHLARIAFGGADEWLLAWQSEHDAGGPLANVEHPWNARLLPDVHCAAAPLGGCRLPTASHASSMTLRNQANDEQDVLGWKWARGAATSLGDLGDPTMDTSYVLCGYDASSMLVLGARTRGGVCGRSLCWKPSSTRGWKGKDAERLPEGLLQVTLMSGVSGAPSIKVKGKGTLLPDPSLPLALPLRVQFQASNGECWEAVYSTSLKNDAAGFRAQSD